ncbi:MAG: alpha/beta hydrolase [Nitrosomonas sp.]|nr:MAG: alpha/beta hydrolase [Nitrosomonas sp.]
MAATLKNIFIDGPAGKLETVLGSPEADPKGIAVVAHPHPLYGGTMENKVIHTLFATLLTLGFITAKFNFRGVGHSDGLFDHGTGEIDDVIAVAGAIRNHRINDSAHLPLLLAGFSFGGAIQLHVAGQLKPEFLVLVAPSVVHLNAPPVPDTTRFALIIQGDRDEIVLPSQILSWATPQSQPIVFIPGAEHFFHGKLIALRQSILSFLRTER